MTALQQPLPLCGMIQSLVVVFCLILFVFFASSEELELKTLRTAAASETEPTQCWLMSVLCF